MEYWNISIADITPCFACEGEDGVINDVHHIENKKSVETLWVYKIE